MATEQPTQANTTASASGGALVLGGGVAATVCLGLALIASKYGYQQVAVALAVPVVVYLGTMAVGAGRAVRDVAAEIV